MPFPPPDLSDDVAPSSAAHCPALQRAGDTQLSDSSVENWRWNAATLLLSCSPLELSACLASCLSSAPSHPPPLRPIQLGSSHCPVASPRLRRMPRRPPRDCHCTTGRSSPRQQRRPWRGRRRSHSRSPRRAASPRASCRTSSTCKHGSYRTFALMSCLGICSLHLLCN